MLETRFPRPLGDIGHPDTFAFPTLKQVVRTASPDRVVRQDASTLLPEFIRAGEDLIAAGAKTLTTSCGFMVKYQADLAAALSVPVATSSLLQIPSVSQMLPNGKRVGVLTIAASALGPDHLRAAGAPLDTPIGTTEGGRTFTEAILSDAEDFDLGAARDDNVDAARQLLVDHPEVGAIVLECTNMGPYAADIAEATGLPVFSIVTLVNRLTQSCKPERLSRPIGR